LVYIKAISDAQIMQIKRGKAIPVNVIKANLGVEVHLQPFLISALDWGPTDEVKSIDSLQSS